MSINFVVLYVLNSVGIRPSFLPYALVLLAVSVVVIGRNKITLIEIFRVNITPVLSVLPATGLSLYLWATSFWNYNFAAANQDAFNHNFWIARIAQVNSVLAVDSFVGSPLQPLGTGSGFYPFSWHSAVAVAHSVGAVPIPILSLAATIVLWGVVLPLGLTALAAEIAPRLKFLGLIASILVQLYPLVPGVPMSWGSMTSTVGIALLPLGFLLVIIAFEKISVFSVLLAIFTFISFIFIHTPAAATLGVLAVSSSVTYWQKFNARILVRFLLAIAACMVPILFVFRSYIFSSDDEIRALWGAVYPFWDTAIGSFILQNVNVPNSPIILTFLLIVGVVYIGYSRFSPALLFGTFGIFIVYLISGAPNGFLNSLRVITTPWYASYERTAWVAVPFFALISAFPLCALFETKSIKRWPQRIIGLALAALVLAGVFNQQVGATKTQLSKGPLVSAVVGKQDRPLLQRLKRMLQEDEIVYTFSNDGSTYAFMYEGILTTSGQTYNRSGEMSPLLEALNNNIRSICSSPEAQEAITVEKIGAFIFGGRLLGWGPPGWQRNEIESLRGLKLIDSGQFLYVAVPDVQSCGNDNDQDL